MVQKQTDLARRKKRIVEEAALVVTLVLSIIGIGITDFSPAESYRYWSFMVFIFAVMAVVIGRSRTTRSSPVLDNLILMQTIHWGATLLTLACVFLILRAGRLNYEDTGLVILLILGLAMILDGARVGWRFGVLGLLISITAVTAAYLEEFVWIIISIAACLTLFSILWVRRQRR